MLKEYGYSYSLNPEFTAIYDLEAAKLFSQDNFKNFSYITDKFLNYFINDQSEYFAECFGFYFASGETNKMLKQNAPQTYKYIESVIN